MFLNLKYHLFQRCCQGIHYHCQGSWKYWILLLERLQAKSRRTIPSEVWDHKGIDQNGSFYSNLCECLELTKIQPSVETFKPLYVIELTVREDFCFLQTFAWIVCKDSTQFWLKHLDALASLISSSLPSFLRRASNEHFSIPGILIVHTEPSLLATGSLKPTYVLYITYMCSPACVFSNLIGRQRGSE